MDEGTNKENWHLYCGFVLFCLIPVVRFGQMQVWENFPLFIMQILRISGTDFAEVIPRRSYLTFAAAHGHVGSSSDLGVM